jgi:hypothetical protein
MTGSFELGYDNAEEEPFMVADGEIPTYGGGHDLCRIVKVL